jgi:hypothetical protein
MDNNDICYYMIIHFVDHTQLLSIRLINKHFYSIIESIFVYKIKTNTYTFLKNIFANSNELSYYATYIIQQQNIKYFNKIYNWEFHWTTHSYIDIVFFQAASNYKTQIKKIKNKKVIFISKYLDRIYEIHYEYNTKMYINQYYQPKHLKLNVFLEKYYISDIITLHFINLLIKFTYPELQMIVLHLTSSFNNSYPKLHINIPSGHPYFLWHNIISALIHPHWTNHRRNLSSKYIDILSHWTNHRCNLSSKYINILPPWTYFEINIVDNNNYVHVSNIKLPKGGQDFYKYLKTVIKKDYTLTD